jgi:hypothetical protein
MTNFHFNVGFQTLREEHGIKVFVVRALRKIFGPRGRRNLHNEKLKKFYFSPSVIGMIQPERMEIWISHIFPVFITVSQTSNICKEGSVIMLVPGIFLYTYTQCRPIHPNVSMSVEVLSAEHLDI